MTENKPKIYITCDKISAEEMDAWRLGLKYIVAEHIEYGDFEIDDAIEVRLHPEGDVEIVLMTDGTP